MGLRLSNRGKAQATVTEVYVADEAGLLRPETARVAGIGQVHFRKATKCKSVNGGFGGVFVDVWVYVWM